MRRAGDAHIGTLTVFKQQPPQAVAPCVERPEIALALTSNDSFRSPMSMNRQAATAALLKFAFVGRMSKEGPLRSYAFL